MSRWSIVVLVVAVLMAVESSADDAISRFFNNLGTTSCLIASGVEMTSDCTKAFNDELNGRPKDETNQKTACCAYLRLKSCVLKIAEKECGDNAESAVNSFLTGFGRGVTSDQCVDYGFITCITVMQWAIAGAIAVAALLLLSCICCCCCRR